MAHLYMDSFDQLLDTTLRSRSGAPPAGMEQRLLAHLANEPAAAQAQIFTTFDRVNTKRSSTSLWSAVVAHAAIFLVIFALTARQLAMRQSGVTSVSTLEVPPPPPLAPKADKMGGGGGQKGPSAVTQGALPKIAQTQIVPPMAPPTIEAKLPVEPTVIAQPNLKMADNKMPDLGMPNSMLHGSSMGNGNGSEIGGGNGGGIGPGSGTNMGGGPMHIGGSVMPPSVLTSVEPEFSEEARKAKFSGNVQVYLWVDEKGNPSHVKVARGIGMGLDEKAVEAVRQYKFKPARKDGKPVKVDLYVDVYFQIF